MFVPAPGPVHAHPTTLRAPCYLAGRPFPFNTTAYAMAQNGSTQFPGWFIGVSTVAMLGFFTWVGSTLVGMQASQAANATRLENMTATLAELKVAHANATGSAGQLGARLQAVEFRLELVERTVRIPTPAVRQDHTLTTAPTNARPNP